MSELSMNSAARNAERSTSPKLEPRRPACRISRCLFISMYRVFYGALDFCCAACFENRGAIHRRREHARPRACREIAGYQVCKPFPLRDLNGFTHVIHDNSLSRNGNKKSE